MALQPLNQRPPPLLQESAEPSDLFDYRRLREYATFAINSLGRRKGLALFVFAAVFGCAVLSLFVLPKEYDSEVKLLGQRNQVISSLAVPGRNMPTDADAPARAAWDTIMRRDNLVALIEQTGLVSHFYSHRSPAGRLRIASTPSSAGPPPKTSSSTSSSACWRSVSSSRPRPAGRAKALSASASNGPTR
jgi:hypothetical protein